MVWNKHYTQRQHHRYRHNLRNPKCWNRFPAGDRHSVSRPDRRQPVNRNHKSSYYHYLLIGLLAVTPAFANEEDPKVQNTSNPVAAATGNVTNQNVNIQNSGAPSRQYFAANSNCNGATLQATPFYMGNDSIPFQSDGYVRNNNYGLQVSVNIPLDGSMVELCKSIARKHEQKMRLDYELVRALKCTEILKTGFTFRPGSRVEVLCHDIVPIVSITNARSNSVASDSDGGSGSGIEQPATPTDQ